MGAADPSVPVAAWACGRFHLPCDRAHIMGILNVTPDSFSDGGRHAALDAALAHAQRMIEEGADIIDVGGESTRPGAGPVPPEVEAERVLPVLRALRGVAVPVSLDTSRPELMRAGLELGVSIINDVRALRRPGALEAVRAAACGVVIMHMQGEPQTMQADPRYDDVVAEVGAALAARRDELVAGGVRAERIALDPGFGFGKTRVHNRRLLAQLDRLVALGQPVLAGLSRKAVLGEVTGRAVSERVAASISAALLAVDSGARIVRVHDVAATRDMIAVWESIRGASAAALLSWSAE